MSNPKLGQIVYIIDSKGKIGKTQIASLSLDCNDGNTIRYQFLNGESQSLPHWFVYADAVAEAKRRIDKQIADLRKQISSLRKKAKAIEADSEADTLSNLAYRVADLDTWNPSRKTKTVKRIASPKNYTEAGTRVYVVIKPETVSRDSSLDYRPHDYFVLETRIEKVWFTSDGQIHYQFSTPFQVGEFFLTKDEARGSCTQAVMFVSLEQEKEHRDKKITENNPL